jgi:hypothetical protein
MGSHMILMAHSSVDIERILTDPELLARKNPDDILSELVNLPPGWQVAGWKRAVEQERVGHFENSIGKGSQPVD